MPVAKLTREQKRALATRDVSVSLSAGAGCGKTHVLTERFLSHLSPTSTGEGASAELRQLIAITFTDAAAREMRSRIRAACFERLEAPGLSDGERSAWLGLLREIDGARVSTIHSFCAALLRSHATEAGLDPTFGVLEQGEAEVLLQEVLDDVLRRRLASHDPTTLDLAAEFGNLAHLKQRIALLVEKRHVAAFRRWLVDDNELEDTATRLVAVWQKVYDRESSLMAVQDVVECAPLNEMRQLLATASPTAANRKFPAAIATLSDLLTRLQSSPENITKDDLKTIAANAYVKGFCNKDDWPTVDDYESYGDVCKKIRETIGKCSPPNWNAEGALAASVLGLKLLRLAGDVAEAYQERKQQIAKLDFDDLLFSAHRLLTDPQNASIREALSADLRLLLVDEFQDTDPLQVDLIKQICGSGFAEGRLFFVGDFKQSIYRFRGAVPREFENLQNEVDENGRLRLSYNFRSLPGVLHFVNALFHDSFGKESRLEPVREAVADSPSVEFLWTIPVEEEAGSKINSEESRRQEAKAIARRLRQLIEGTTGEMPIVDRDIEQPRPRPLRPGDVAILFRALSDVRLYEEALREQGLEYYLVGGHAFYAQQEIFDVLNLLRAVASAADEISLAGVLRSPFFALADEALFWLVEHGGSLNAGLFDLAVPQELSGEEQAKVETAARTLRQLRSLKDAVPIAALLNTALDMTGYDAVLVTEFLGERKLANLHKLIEQARTADAGDSDLNEFIVQLTEFTSQPPKEPLASTSAESADVIRLMTIHRAKGLQFPFVVLPDLDRHGKPMNAAAALDDELGPLIRLANDEDEPYATGMTLFDARERAAELDERKRLLYVATTRAADYLLLSSSIESIDTPKSDWMQLLAAHFDLETGEYIGELPTDYVRPQVHVAPPAERPPKPVSQPRGADLVRVLDEAHGLAAEGSGIIPPHVGPIRVDVKARRQFSFSQLAEFQRASGDQEDEAPLRIQAGTTASGPSNSWSGNRRSEATAFGLLVHDVLTRIDFVSNAIDEEIARWCEHLASEYVYGDIDQAAQRAARMISQFVASPRGQQLAAAKSLHRETEFLLAWPISPLPPGEGQGEGVPEHAGRDDVPCRYIRGFIDCLYQDGQGIWQIVDFKTNEVSKTEVDHLDRLADRYRLQLFVYALAVEHSLGESPSELVLALLQPDMEIVMPWNKEARCHAIELINQAMVVDLEAISATGS